MTFFLILCLRSSDNLEPWPFMVFLSPEEIVVMLTQQSHPLLLYIALSLYVALSLIVMVLPLCYNLHYMSHVSHLYFLLSSLMQSYIRI